jgi:hypothetical protein
MSPRNEVVDRLGGFKNNLNNGLLVDISRSFHENVLATVCTAWIYKARRFRQVGDIPVGPKNRETSQCSGKRLHQIHVFQDVPLVEKPC